MFKKNTRSVSLASQNIKYKLKIAFYLMSILPMLVSIYLVSSYILPRFGFKADVVLATVISIVIALIGFFLLKEVFDRIVSVTTTAKLIAAGDISRTVPVAEGDEIADLSGALNNLTLRIRNNMDELKNYSDKTTQINIEIQKRVLVLSSLLQVSSLITQGAKIDDILRIVVEKTRLLASSDVAYLLQREKDRDTFVATLTDGVSSDYLLSVRVDASDEVFAKTIMNNRPLIVDKSKDLSEKLRQLFYAKFKLRNTLVLPIFLRGRVMAMLGIGNTRESFVYQRDEIEFLDIFAKQIAITIENDLLMSKIGKLEIKDALTGLYNRAFINSRLHEEIKRAIIYQRPCAFVVMDVDCIKKFHDKFGYLETETQLKKIAVILRDSISEVDRVGRIGDDEFGIILPEKNKRQAQEIAEDIRKKVEYTYSEEADPDKKLTLSGGVSENPLDGVEADELISKATELLRTAKEMGRNRVVGIKGEPQCH
ncbi:MAG: diguanylate cyclase [Candidatus Omnitrophota bacterium]